MAVVLAGRLFASLWLLTFGLGFAVASAKASPVAGSIISGVPWHDQKGAVVSAHAGAIIKEGDRYYFFGEFKRDGGNEFAGFSCYSSADLANWTFEGMVLPAQESGPLGPGRVGERPKVLKCPATGEFVMYMHTDDSRYRDQAVGYATSATINGVYTFRGPLLFEGKPVKKWDMSVFQDTDGSGYLVTHSGNLYRLGDDYKSVTARVIEGMTPGCEAPAIFKRNGLYYWLGSGLTGWERNDNYYFTATSLHGPWEKRGNFAPAGSLTWNSQTTFVLPIVGSETTTWMFMGDRWAHPRQNSSATYVWQPLHFDDDGSMRLPEFRQSWQVDTETGRWAPVSLRGEPVDLNDRQQVRFSEAWRSHADETGFADRRSDEKGSSLSVTFTGTQVALRSVARPDGGFGQIEIRNARGEQVAHAIIETYALKTEASLKYLSPVLTRGTYTMTIRVLGEHFFWQGKTASHGSKGDFVSVQDVLVVP